MSLADDLRSAAECLLESCDYPGTWTTAKVASLHQAADILDKLPQYEQAIRDLVLLCRRTARQPDFDERMLMGMHANRIGAECGVTQPGIMRAQDAAEAAREER